MNSQLLDVQTGESPAIQVMTGYEDLVIGSIPEVTGGMDPASQTIMSMIVALDTDPKDRFGTREIYLDSLRQAVNNGYSISELPTQYGEYLSSLLGIQLES